MKDVALFLLRAWLGGILAAHGAQKLFGAFGGHGLQGTGGLMEKLGLKPGERWATVAGLSELGGGLLTGLGLGGPIGPITTLAPMTMATMTAHAGKPIWANEGGPELPVTNATIGTALALTGPGKISLDHLFGIRVPGWMNFLALLSVGAGVSYALASRELGRTQSQTQPAPVPMDETQQQIRQIDEQQAAA